MTIQQLQDWVSDDWKNHSKSLPTSEQQILYVLEELGEVAEAIRKHNRNKERIQKPTDVGSEIADVLISLVTLANTYNVDLTTEILKFKMRLQERHGLGL